MVGEPALPVWVVAAGLVAETPGEAGVMKEVVA